MSAMTPTAPVATKGHPKGLYLLFTTEMWERMSYYGMRALLVLYMTAQADRGGFGWSKETALSIYGWYTGLVYLTPLFGGYLADKYLGQRRAVIIGGTLMMIGHFLMAVPGVAAFYAALGFLIAGNGMFKPNISTMVGGLYKQGDPRRDGAFTIFYMGINLGAFLAPLVCGTLGETIGWHWGFGTAGIGMGLGLMAFLLFQNRLLGDIGLAPVKQKLHTVEEKQPLTREEKYRIGVILVLLFFVVVFWAGFEQAGGLMNLYTDEKVDRSMFGWTVPTTWLQAVNPILIVALGPVFSMIWTSLGRIRKDPPVPVKMAFGLFLLSLGFVFMLGAVRQGAADGKAALMWVVAAYLFHTLGELCLSPVGLSMVTKVAPVRMVSLMMGVWFLANFIANKLAGTIGAYAETLGEFQLFLAIVVVTAAAGALLLVISAPLKRMMHGADEVSHADAAGTSEAAPVPQRKTA